MMTVYSITDLGTLQGDAPSPVAINTSGIIAGGLMDRAFRYESGTLAALQLPPSASDATAAGISSSNPERIAGWVGPAVNCRASGLTACTSICTRSSATPIPWPPMSMTA